MILVIIICINLISLNSQIQILSNDINHYMAVKLYTLCGIREHEKDVFIIILCVYISFSVFSMCTEGLNAGKRVSDF